MPLYEYRCTHCGYKFEKIQKFSDQPESVCPQCGGELVRPMTAPALKFEGAGWYINDYAPKAGSSTANASAETKSESKPAETGASTPAPASGGASAAPAASGSSSPSTTSS